MESSSPASSRLTFLDWTRGLAALIMLQGHVFHSFAKTELRNDGPYVLSQFVGGLPPAIFLFLTGVTLAFLMHRGDRQGLPVWRRIGAALRRASYLLMLAFLFRLQLWLFGLPASPWTDLLKVDILNCMGLAIAVISLMAVFPAVDRARLCAVLGVGIAAASPLVSQLDWNGVPAVLRAYVAPDLAAFGFFPWAAFLAFGVSAGSILRATGQDQMHRLLQWSALVGFGLILGGQYFSNVPYSLYPKSDFWLDSPALIFIKLGVILLILSFAFLWTRHATADSWSWVRQLGTNSLLVYWVHIELVYGRWFSLWRESLTVAQTTVASVALIALMVLLSTWKSNWNNWRNWWRTFGWTTAPRRVSGD
jgi:uncharacterized membrane protein